MKKFLTLPLPLAIISSLLFGGPVFAQTEELKAATQGVVESGDRLEDIKTNEELTDEERVAKEAEERRTALEKIFELSQLEVKTLLLKVNAVDELSVEYIELQIRLLKQLNLMATLLKDFQNRLEEAASLDAVKDLAIEFKAWREEAYNVTVQVSLEFISVFQAQTLLRIAENRFDKIANDLRRLRSSRVVKIEILEPLLNWAGQDLKEARALLNQAMILLLETKEDKPSVNEIVKNMVSKIKDAYSRFLEMSSLVRKMVNAS